MIINPSSDIVLPQKDNIIVEDGMIKDVKQNYFLEVEKANNNPYGQNPYAVNYQQCTGIDQLCDEIKNYAENFTRLRPSTIKRDIRYLRTMNEKNQPFPIDFLEPSYTQFLLHMTWYKKNFYNENTGQNFYGLKQKKESYYLYLKACGIPETYFQYELPNNPGIKIIEFPDPDLAVKIIKHKFLDDKEENWLYQFIHTYNFIVGPRSPSEDCVVTMDGINWDECSITFRQPKLGGIPRKVFLPEVFFTGKTRKSLKNYIDYHRPHFITQYSDDYLFVSPKTGKPFTPAFLKNKLNNTGKMVYPKFHSYMARHFCATAKLIECYLKHDPDPIKTTQDFMCHDNRDNTDRYTKLARIFFEKHKYNWFKRILKNKNQKHPVFCWVESVNEQPLESKQGQKTFVSTGNPSRARYSPAQGITAVLQRIKTKLKRFVPISTSNSFFFSFGNTGVGA